MRKFTLPLLLVAAGSWTAEDASADSERRRWRPFSRRPLFHQFVRRSDRTDYQSGIYYDSGMAFHYEWATPVVKNRTNNW